MTPAQVSHYRLLEKIGEGGMGEVYLAEDTILRRRVAIKFLSSKLTNDERAKKRLLREARAAAKLDHPNICGIYEVNLEGDLGFIAMQYVEGDTLASKVRLNHLDPRESLSIAIQVTDALADAHTHGIIHRDIKPENIMIGSGGQVKVLDFGLAKKEEDHYVLPDAETVSLLSEVGAIVGTVPYMSPEQLRAEKLDARSDIFGIGTVIYEMLTGRQPFLAGNRAESIAAILTSEPQPLNSYVPNIPVELDRIVRKCLQKDKEQRYQSARDLLADLESIAGDFHSASTLRRSARVLPARRSRSILASPWLIITLLAAVVIAVTVLYFRVFRQPVQPVPTVTTINSIAVLPFANESTDPEMEYLCDGLTESLINSLSQLPNIKVIARTSAFHYKGRGIDPPSVGRELNVQTLLLGRVVQYRNDFSISIELVDVEKNSRLWGVQYTRRLSDLPSTQGEMSKDILDRLRPKLAGEQSQHITKNYTNNTEAYQLYLKGRYYWNKRSLESLTRAADYFQQASQKDPSYALAYVGIADCYLLSSILPPREASATAGQAVARALALDGNLAEAHASLGFINARYNWNWDEAQNEYQRAIELNPNYAVTYYWYADLLMTLGRQDEAVTQLKKAQELDPLSQTINVDLGKPIFYGRQYDRALDHFRKALDLDQNFWVTHYCLGLVYEQKGMHAESIKELQTATTLSERSPTPLAMLGFAYASAGKVDKTYEVLAQLQELAKIRHISPYGMALIYTGLGKKDLAFQWLELAYEERDPALVLLKVAPWFDRLRSDERFVSLTQRIGLPA